MGGIVNIKVDLLRFVAFSNVLFCFALFLSVASFSQQKPIPLNRFFTHEVERSLLRDSVLFVHSASKPYVENKLNLDRVTGYAKDSIKVYENYDDKLLRSHFVCLKLKQKFFNSNLVSTTDEDVFIAIDPILEIGRSFDFADNSEYTDTVAFWNNIRGLQVVGDLGKTFSFQTGFYECQTFFPRYQKDLADSTKVIPGMGRWKTFPADKGQGFDYAMAYGLSSYSPRKWLNIQFGHGKNFIGHGYRSLLLSDAAFNYPYIKSTIYFFDGKMQYTCAYASLQTLSRLPIGEVPEALYKRKGYSYNYLSWMPHRRIEIGVFEGIVWKKYDEKEGSQPQPWGGYVPIIGFNTASNGIANENNIMIGANLKVQATKHSFIYGQVAIDDPLQGAIGYQIGVKYFDFIFRNLDLHAEWNSIGDNVYASHYPLQSYSHTNQPLGHPAGPATQEFVGIVNYRYHRVIAQLKYNQIAHGTWPEATWSNDPLIETTTLAQWPVKHIQHLDIQAGCYVNPKTNLQILVGWTSRVERADYNGQPDFYHRSSIFYFTLRTNLINRYADF